MAKKNTDVTCHNCGAKNPANYTFCFHCSCPPKKAKASVKKTSAQKKKTKAKK